MAMSRLGLTFLFVAACAVNAFVAPSIRRPSLVALNQAKTGFRIAEGLIKSLVEDEKCYSTEAGAVALAEACAINIVFEDCFETQPIVGRAAMKEYMLEKVASRKKRGDVRIDRVSDGTMAAGFAWTWESGNQEGLRGTTFFKLNDQGQIEYGREIPEPLFKPGNATRDLLKAITADSPIRPKRAYEKQTPTTASEIVYYLFNVQDRDLDETMRFFDDDIVYRDFNYENVMRGKEEVKQFIMDFDFPGIEFRTQIIDDGVDSCCFTWECVIGDSPESIKGISFYELNPETRKVCYVRDIPESAVKPPLLGAVARDMRPGLGVFQGAPKGSRGGI